MGNDSIRYFALNDVEEERRRQLTQTDLGGEGYSYEHDDAHTKGELAMAAAYFAAPDSTDHHITDKLMPKGWTLKLSGDRRRDLVKAGALILAEIERLDRAAAEPKGRSIHFIDGGPL